MASTRSTSHDGAAQPQGGDALGGDAAGCDAPGGDAPSGEAQGGEAQGGEAAGGVTLDVSGYARRARRLADLSQRDLAARLGVDQATVSRAEGTRGLDVATFVRILAAAHLRVAVVDETGTEVTPMPVDVFRDRGGRRRPAHLDVHAGPETPTMAMLLHAVDPVPVGGSWHHLRRERDRLRVQSGTGGSDEQLSISTARARASRARSRRGAAHRRPLL